MVLVAWFWFLGWDNWRFCRLVGIGADGWNYGAVGPLEAILKQGRGLVVWGFDLGARDGGERCG